MQGIKSRNPKTYLLSQLALMRFVFLAFDFITHVLSFLFSLLFTYYYVIELIWHATTSTFGYM